MISVALMPLAGPALATAPAPSAAPASDAAQPGDAATINGRTIYVIAGKIKGQVDAPQTPIATFDEEDIAAYGASSITDLLEDISAETDTGRGRGASGPVILVNGQRISSFREIHDYPPEAIQKIEVLPEETALRFGYPPDQRVVNIILKKHYFTHSMGGQFTMPQAGGTTTEKGDVGLVRIDNDRRLNITLRADHTSALLDAERNVTESNAATVPGDPSQSLARTLVSSGSDYSLNANYTLPLAKQPGSGSLSFNTTISRSDSTGLSGLNSVTLGDALRTLPGALEAIGRTDNLQGGLTLNKPVSSWQLTATLDAGHAVTTNNIQNRADTGALLADFADGTITATGPLPTVAPGSFTRTQTRANTATSLVTVSGRPVSLPAGDLALTVKGGFAYTGQQGSSSNPLAPSTDLTRGDASFGGNLGIPITSRKEEFGAGAGDITLNLSGGADRLSDFGWLTNWSGGVTWGITPSLNLQASYIFNQAAPSLANLGSPQTASYNVPVFDYVTGQSANVTVISGGNPNLVRQSQHDIKLGANWSLPFSGKTVSRGSLIAEFYSNRSNNVTTSFPALTAAVQSAFHNRFTYDANGNITAIDETAITLAEQRETRLRWGLNLGGSYGNKVVSRGRLGMGGPGGGFGGPPPGGGFGGGHDGTHREGAGPGGPAGGGEPPRGPRYDGRWNLAIYHTVQFIDRVQLTSGGPALNLLGGDTLGSGGVARQSLELDAGTFYKGLGLRFNGTWTAATHVNGAASDGSGDLRFGALLKVNARMFLDFNQKPGLIAAVPFLKGARMSIMANNIFDQIQKVTSPNGTTPTAYQPAYEDPLGRVLGVEFRKMF